jgi:hypothetical protein
MGGQAIPPVITYTPSALRSACLSGPQKRGTLRQAQGRLEGTLSLGATRRRLAQRFFWITLISEWGPGVSWVSSQIMMPP